jgi:HD superfamily phosphodiesterase
MEAVETTPILEFNPISPNPFGLPQFDVVRKFVEEHTRAFDDGHRVEHAEQVNTLASIIIQKCIKSKSGTPLNDIEKLVLMLAAMLHDVRDHKYIEQSVSAAELIDFVKSAIPGEWKAFQAISVTYVDVVLTIIDSISYTKEFEFRSQWTKIGFCDYMLGPLNDTFRLIRDAVSDADKLGAIGADGILRCRQYLSKTHPEYSEQRVVARIIEHCHEKLLTLYPEHYIRTEYGRKLAEPLHQYLVDYVKLAPSVKHWDSVSIAHNPDITMDIIEKYPGPFSFTDTK